MRTLRLLLLASCLYAVAPTAASASMIGTTADCAITPTPLWTCAPTSAVVGAGSEFDLVLSGSGAFFQVDLAASSVTLTYVGGGGLGAGAGEFLTLSNLFGPFETITGFNFSISGGVTGLTVS